MTHQDRNSAHTFGTRRPQAVRCAILAIEYDGLRLRPAQHRAVLSISPKRFEVCRDHIARCTGLHLPGRNARIRLIEFQKPRYPHPALIADSLSATRPPREVRAGRVRAFNDLQHAATMRVVVVSLSCAGASALCRAAGGPQVCCESRC